MKPKHFDTKNEDAFVFTLDDGKVLSAAKVERTLRDAALEVGLDPRIVATHSLRAGGCTAMMNAGLPEWRIQRRGRWVSNCWKRYAWGSRSQDDGLADTMASASSNLFAML